MPIPNFLRAPYGALLAVKLQARASANEIVPPGGAAMNCESGFPLRPI